MLAERERFEPAVPACYNRYNQVTESDIEVENSKQTIQDLMHEIAAVKQQISDIHGSMSAGLVTGYERNPESSVLARSSPLSSTKLQQGSRLDSSANVSAVGDYADRFWIFFTRIKNTVTEKQMSDMVCQSLRYSPSSTSPVVKKLVPYWKDTSAMPYISFKVGIDPMMKTSALLPSTWPKNIHFREFYNDLHVWEPSG